MVCFLQDFHPYFCAFLPLSSVYYSSRSEPVGRGSPGGDRIIPGAPRIHTSSRQVLAPFISASFLLLVFFGMCDGCESAWNNWVPTGRIFMKFDI